VRDRLLGSNADGPINGLTDGLTNEPPNGSTDGRSGVLGDKYDLRRMIALGMWATAAVVLAFGLGALADIHSLAFYAALWGINGLIQSTGWPANVAVMCVRLGGEGLCALLASESLPCGV